MLAGADTAFCVTQVEQLENLLFGYTVLVTSINLLFFLGSAGGALFVHLLAAVLFENLESTTEALALLVDENSSLGVGFLFNRMCGVVWIGSVLLMVISARMDGRN